MRQAITTKYIGPTDHRCSRVKAKCDAGSVTVPWDHDLGVEENHTAAMKELALRLGWESTDWYG